MEENAEKVITKLKEIINRNGQDYLSVVFPTLYSEENEDSWKEKNLEGLSQYCEKM